MIIVIFLNFTNTPMLIFRAFVKLFKLKQKQMFCQELFQTLGKTNLRVAVFYKKRPLKRLCFWAKLGT